MPTSGLTHGSEEVLVRAILRTSKCNSINEREFGPASTRTLGWVCYALSKDV